jgi:hypothetical protein
VPLAAQIDYFLLIQWRWTGHHLCCSRGTIGQQQFKTEIGINYKVIAP